MHYLKLLSFFGILAMSVGAGRVLAAAPANDNYADAQVLPSQQTIANVSGTTIGATVEAGEVAMVYATDDYANSVWYVWTAPASGKVVLSEVDADQKHVQKFLVAIGDSLLGSKFILDHFQSSDSFYAVAGATYHIGVYWQRYRDPIGFTFSLGYAGGLPADTLSVSPAANDEFADATVFPPAGQKAVFYTHTATFEPFESDMLSAIGGSKYGSGFGSVWARWQAPFTGKATLTAVSASGAAVLIVVGVGNSVADFAQNRIGANDRGGGLFDCQAGVEYRFYYVCENNDQIFTTLSAAAGNIGGGGGGTAAPFALQAGTFNGFVGTSGLITLALQKTGKFTGKLVLDTGTYTLKGALTASGDFVGQAGQSAVPLELHLNPSANASIPAAITITGSTNGGAFAAYHTAYNKIVPRPEAGPYTVLLTPAVSGDSVPQGVGMGHLTVGKTGTAKFIGRLGDGTTFSCSYPLVGDGSGGIQSAFYSRAIYAKKGLLAGPIGYHATATSDVASMATWMKPQQSKGSYYVGGFTSGLDLKGQRYVKPVRSMALNLAAGLGNGSVIFSGGGLSAPITESVTLSTTNKLTVDGGNPSKVKLSVNAATGDVSGSFLHPLTNKVVKFKGILSQNPTSPEAGGYFLGPVVGGAGLSGRFHLTP